MRTFKKGLAFLLLAAMLITLFPVAALADGGEEEQTGSPVAVEEVIYNTGAMEITVGGDKARAEGESESYVLFEDDGSYTIELEPDAFFPYEVQFTYRSRTTVEWFMDPEDSVEIGGHTFRVTSQQTDPSVLNQIGFWVGGDYIPAYPEEKVFTNDGPDVMPASMMPLEEKTAYLDMRGYLPDELKAVKISAVTNNLTSSSYGDGSVAAWAKWSYYDEDGKHVSENDNYTIVGENDTIDLSSNDRYSSTSFVLELIVGTADQLNLSNVRYRVNVRLNSYYGDLLEYSVYSSGETREEIPVYRTYLGENGSYGKIYQIGVDKEKWNQGDEVYLSVKPSAQYAGLSATVYEGYYEQESDIPTDAVDITDQIWDQENMAAEGGYLKDYSYQRYYEGMPKVTIVLKRGDTTAMVLPVTLYMYQSRMDLNFSYRLFKDTDGMRTNVYKSYDYAWSNNYAQYTFALTDKNPADGTYYFNLEMNNPADTTTANCGIANVQKAVVGYYRTEAEIPEDAADIKAQLFSDASQAGGGYGADYSKGIAFTVVDANGDIHWFALKTATMSLEYTSNLYGEASEGVRTNVKQLAQSVSGSQSSPPYGTYPGYLVLLKEGYSANAEYYYNLSMKNTAAETTTNCGIDNVKQAVVGYYETAAEIPANAVDIKDQLFSDASANGGYKADYSNGITFTVVDINDGIHWFCLGTVADETSPDALPDAPDPLSTDTYFRMQSASKAKDANGNTSSGTITAYIMPNDADSYYFNGFQTVFLLNCTGSSGSYTYSAVEEATIIPSFYTGSTNEEIHIGHDGSSTTPQISDKTPVEFVSGKAIQYSAKAEDHITLKNYWVTFVTQQSGPMLFVNGINDESRQETVVDEEGNESIVYTREVFLTEDYNNHHDIFFANIGDEDLTGLSVKLEDAKNIALDPYWTIGETTTLSPFTTTVKSTTYGELANVAKIRLVPDDEETSGAISGTLTISSENGGSVTIKLTGVAGVPKITTTNVVDGVKYVPYSSLIQTNNMYGTDSVKFEIVDGEVPGLDIYPNGEIYGVPTEAGDFTFTVRTMYDYTKFQYLVYNSENLYDERTYTIHIADNTDENVWTATDGSYAVTDYIGTATGNYHYVLNSYVDEMFVTEGLFENFIDFWLDGKKLEQGVDYDAESGSTKITIRAQTLRNAGSGTHTLAAEFREGGDGTERSGDLKRAGQNYTVAGSSSSSSGSGSFVSTYAISAPTGDHGSIIVSPGSVASKGTVITVTVKPDAGYMLDSLTVTDKDGTVLELTGKGDGTYTFIMPASAVSVSAVFTAVYSTTAPAVDNGAVTVNPENAAKGALVTVTTVPDEGYRLDALTITDASGNLLELSNMGGGVYVFTMPDSAIKINASFVPIETISLPFVDVAEDAWYYDAVKYAYENGLMVGMDDTIFSPNSSISRAMIATILYRLEEEPAADTSLISEEEAGLWYTNAMAWAIENNIITGYGNGVMGSADDITREQIATVLYRYANLLELDVSVHGDISQFGDAGLVSDWAADALEWVIGAGLFQGKGDGVLDPCGTTTRAEAATVLMRFIELLEKNTANGQ